MHHSLAVTVLLVVATLFAQEVSGVAYVRFQHALQTPSSGGFSGASFWVDGTQYGSDIFNFGTFTNAGGQFYNAYMTVSPGNHLFEAKDALFTQKYNTTFNVTDGSYYTFVYTSPANPPNTPQLVYLQDNSGSTVGANPGSIYVRFVNLLVNEYNNQTQLFINGTSTGTPAGFGGVMGGNYYQFSTGVGFNYSIEFVSAPGTSIRGQTNYMLSQDGYYTLWFVGNLVKPLNYAGYLNDNNTYANIALPDGAGVTVINGPTTTPPATTATTLPATTAPSTTQVSTTTPPPTTTKQSSSAATLFVSVAALLALLVATMMMVMF